MHTPAKNEFLPYADTSPGFESIYTGDKSLPDEEAQQRDAHLSYAQDAEGNPYIIYSSWGFSNLNATDWSDEIRHLNEMQQQLGELDESTRLIRAQISSLQCCDNGVPVTIDEILDTIGTGKPRDASFHAGCWLSLGERGTQPGQPEAMAVIETVLRDYLAGVTKQQSIEAHPAARGFIERAYDWLGPAEDFSALQRLLFERLLLPFDYFTSRTDDHVTVHETCYGPDGRGAEIDREIAELAGLPPIHANYTREYRETLKGIDDPEKRGIYQVCGAMAHGLHGLSDCHHSSFRWIESWIHGIGRFSLEVEGRIAGVEGIRLGRLMFGYALALDRWLQGVPMQWLLLDLGHLDLGFDPKSEILRVYAYLGERTPLKEWLAACLWYTLVLERPASLYDWGWRHRELIAAAQERGIGVRDWMNARLGRIA